MKTMTNNLFYLINKIKFKYFIDFSPIFFIFFFIYSVLGDYKTKNFRSGRKIKTYGLFYSNLLNPPILPHQVT